MNRMDERLESHMTNVEKLNDLANRFQTNLQTKIGKRIRRLGKMLVSLISPIFQ